MPSNLHIRPLTSPEDLQACVRLQRETWGERFSELVPPAILIVAQRIGGVAAGAFDDEGVLHGFIFGLTGWEAGRPVHWSDMLAVRAGSRDRGIGRRLKLYQRERLLPLGVERVYWTFDPLESRNAYVNFARLGVVAREYRRDLYGDTDSPLHAGIGTDRLVALWPIASERVRGRLEGTAAPPRAQEIRDLPLVVQVQDRQGLPVCGQPLLDLSAPRLRLPVPEDVQGLKERDPQLARGWRHCTRAAFMHYLQRGYEARELVREQGWSSYVLERTETGSVA